ncbi:ATP-binding protein [Fructobacillus ficulneus]|uniref:YhaN AAA domain-containing protein n=1 Tax=Fructobacillus ficulneus TaxID=157463 RepID=A0A0K8MK20_9LACO|nr:AAA family ATPase [Fructobacillus ficulneus]GAP00509.1 hypothetical protein FFIC_285280 [Fructobacillus ficulneus]
MKIKAIEITGFGRWTNVTIDNLAEWQVIYGENEAGKSTLKDFILGIFFGFKTRASQNYEPRSGAQYGGALVVTVHGQDYRISRKGRTQSVLTVTKVGMESLELDGERFLKQIFGSLNRVDYEQIFAFNEHDLSLVGQITGPDLEKQLLAYTKPQASKWLAWADDHQSTAVQLFSKQKNGKRPLNQASQQYLDLKKSHQDQAGALSDYLTAGLEETDLIDKIKAKEGELESLNKKYQNLDQANRTWPLYQEGLTLQKELNGFAKDHPQVKVISPADQKQMKELGLELDWLNQQLGQIQHPEPSQSFINSGSIDENQQETLRTMANQLATLEDNQQQSDRRNQQLSQFQNFFTGSIPRPLSSSDSQALTGKNYWLWVTLAGLVGTLLAVVASLGLVTQGIFLLVTVASGFLANRHHQQGQAILKDYAPLDPAAIIKAQGHVQRAAQVQDELANLTRHQEQLVQDLVSSLVRFDGQFRGRFTDPSLVDSQAVQDLVHQVLEGQNQDIHQQLDNELAKNQRMQQERELLQQKTQVQSVIQNLLGQNGLTSLADLDQAVAGQDQQGQQIQRLADLKERIGSDLWELLSHYRNQANLQVDLAQVRDKIEAGQLTVKGYRDQIQRLRVSKASLVSADQYQSLGQQLANQEADLKGGFGQYLAETLVVEMVKRALIGQEEDLSDQVQEVASQYFSRLTGGRYHKMAINQKKVEVIGQDGESFLLAELSTGARDQAYLAVRLALVASLKLGEDLPLLIDDGFVNFDDRRQAEVLSLLQDLTATHQILFWTFNRHLVTDKQINLGEIHG